jgi:hypothetical protein
VSENRVLRRIFGPKRDETTRERRKLHNEELHDMFWSPNTVRGIKSRNMSWTQYVARVGVGRGVYRVFVGNPEGKIPLGRPRRRWGDNIKMSHQETCFRGMDFIELAQNRWEAFVKEVMNIRVP